MAQEVQGPDPDYTAVYEFERDPPRHIKLALDFGIVVLGWGLEHYYHYATFSQGYETVGMWGVQSSGKSSRMLQQLFWVYRFHHLVENEIIKTEIPRGVPFLYDDDLVQEFTDLVDFSFEVELEPREIREIWERVLKALVFTPSELVETLEAVPDNEIIPALGWDDILVHFPASMFKTNIKQYEAIDSSWAAIRTKASIIITTLPIVSRLAKNIKDNITVEVFLGRNQMEMCKRIFYLPALDSLDANLFKITLEKPGVFDLFKVPKWVWQQYWKRRLKLANEALATLKGTTEPDNTDGYTAVMAVAGTMGISPNTIQQMASRGVIVGKKIRGKLYIENESAAELAALYEGGKLKSVSRKGGLKGITSPGGGNDP